MTSRILTCWFYRYINIGRHDGFIDDLSIDYNANQRKRVADDADVRLTYSGAFDFVDGVSRITEYSYNACLIFHGAKIITFL